MTALVVGVALASSMSASGPAFAQVQTGNDLLDACTSQGDVQTGFCVGYFVGAWEGIKLGSLTIGSVAAKGMTADEMDQFLNTFIGVCLPVEATSSQVVDISIQYLVENPEVRHESARSLMHRALQDAFPC